MRFLGGPLRVLFTLRCATARTVGVSMIYGGVGLVKVNRMLVAAAGGLYLLVRVRFRVFLG